MSIDKLTIIIPTINRSTMLDRTLSYYMKAGIYSKIILADSSNKSLKAKNKNLVSKYSTHLDIEYFHVSEETDVGDKVFVACEMVKTPYVLMIGDDDFVLKSSASKIIRGLENDKELAAGYGQRLGIAALSQSTKGTRWMSLFPWYDMQIINKDPLDRIRHIPVPSWQQYPYAIFRTHVMKKAYQVTNGFKSTQYIDFFINATILFHGKWKKFDCLFTVCNADSSYYTLRDRSSFPYYWGKKGNIISQTMSQPFWSEYVIKLSKNVVDLLPKSDSDDLAREIRDIYYAINNRYIEHHYIFSRSLFNSNQWLSLKINTFIVRLTRILYIFLLPDKNGGVSSYWVFFRGLLKETVTLRLFKNLYNQDKSNKIKNLLISIRRTGTLDYELVNLLSPSSAYYKEFSLIFKVWKSNPTPKVYTNK